MQCLEDTIAGLIRKCIGCGLCTEHCPSYRHGGLDPHRMMTQREGEILDCILCGTCSRVCDSTDPLTVMKSLMYLRRKDEFPDHFERTGYIHPMEDCPSRYELDPSWDSEGIHIMPGCVIRAKAPFLEYASAVALRSIGIGCLELEGNGCCIRPAQFMAMSTEDKLSYKRDMIANASGNRVLALCHGCSEEMNSSSLDVENVIHLLHENLDRLPRLDKKLSVAIEPGCQAEHLLSEMREVVEAIGCTVINDRIGCCGKDTRVSSSLMRERMEECSGCDVIVVGCPKCFTKYDAYPEGMPVMFLTELVAMAVGDVSSLKYHRIPFSGSNRIAPP